MRAMANERYANAGKVRFSRVHISALYLLFVLTMALTMPFSISAADIYSFIG